MNDTRVNKKTPVVLHIGTDELFGLSGALFPDTKPRFPRPIQVRHSNGKTFVRGRDREVALNRDDTLRLDDAGRVSVILGPSGFKSLGEKFFARTTLKHDGLVEYTSAKVDLAYGEKAEVFKFEDQHGNLMADRPTTNGVPFGYGKVVLVYSEDQYTRKRFYKRIIIRLTAKDDSSIVKFLEERLKTYLRKPSGVFETAQQAALEKWLAEPVEEPKQQAKKTKAPRKTPRRQSTAAVAA